MNTAHFNQLTPAEDERLALLAEECAEVIQAVTKIQRHGYASCHPTTGVNNCVTLTREMGDLLAAMQLLYDAGDVCEKAVLLACRNKQDAVNMYLHHQSKGLL
jgi:NTP pyrophosphatase (non-canonical NTP hydrolase)